MWRSLVARFVRDEEVAGSNPVTPTASSPPAPLAGTGEQDPGPGPSAGIPAARCPGSSEATDRMTPPLAPASRGTGAVRAGETSPWRAGTGADEAGHRRVEAP